jgi:hypothetical protein
VYHAFRFAAWWTLIVPDSFWAYLWIKNLSELPPTGGFVRITLIVTVLISIAAILAIYIGMWIHLFVHDDPSLGTKALWSFIFFLTGWFGSILYFFAVYKRQFSKAPAL